MIPRIFLIWPLEELSFICLLVRQGLSFDKIIGCIPYTSIHDELPEEEKESSLKQEEKVLIAKSQPLQSQDLAVNPEPSIPQNPPREQEIQPFKISCEDDLFNADFGKSLNF